MKTRDFFFDLPEALIAQEPSGERGDDRLMVLRSQSNGIEHRKVCDLPELLPKNTLLVLNDSRVRKARLYGTNRKTNVPAEFLLVKQIGERTWEALCKRVKRRKPGDVFLFPGGKAGTENETEAEITRLTDAGVILEFNRPIDDEYLDAYGHIPLPPYIKRGDNARDAARYQNVYAQTHGSIASPTAGLHFTEALLSKIRESGIETAFVTLHVGLGTFLPVRTERIEDHRMHEEQYTIGGDCAEKVNRALRENRPVTAAGTTSLRCLESAWRDGRVRDGSGSTDIFIYPGYPFKVVTNLFTNFHTPCSTLLMLVSALAGRDFVMDAYRKAVAEKYRFFSYGDAMLILRA
jgi:S-adenosylmethionine:tRNA ribosyltransferase-isomerase